jgi:S1-C subfamily serine protease
MFTEAYTKIRECTYVLIGRTEGKTASCGTAFMIAPGVLATVAHVLCKDAGDSTAFQETILVMRDPEISRGERMETATVIAVDAEYDIGLLKIENPRTKTFTTFAAGILQPGTDVGAVGYPLMRVKDVMAQKAAPLLRFQGGHISAIYGRKGSAQVRQLVYYETDVPMYKGSSGCPGFLASGEVFGMHVAEWHDGGTEDNPGQRAFSMWVPASAIIAFAKENWIEVQTSS